MLRKIGILFTLFLGNLELKGQIGGEGIMPITSLPLHARTMAWGGYTLAQPLSDVQFAIDNPALLNSQCHGQYGGSFGTVMPGVRIGGAGYAHTIKEGHHVSFHAQYLDYGKMDAFDAGGNPEGTIMANEMKFLIGYSREFSSRLVLGAQTGFTYAVLGPFVSTAAMVNLGATYSRSDSGVYWGLSIKNMGLQLINYRGSEREPLPFNIAFGASYKPLHMPFRFHATLHSIQRFMGLTYNEFLESSQIDLGGSTVPSKEAGFADKLSRHLALGGELVLGKHLGILVGYNHQRRMEMSPVVRSGLTGFGWGVRMKIWKYHLTYASASMFPGQNTNTLSLSLIPGFYH
jgi:hypothetical protein